MSDIKTGELPIMVRLELEDLGEDYQAIPGHLNTMQARIVELEGVVTDLLLGSSHDFLTVNAIRINAQKTLLKGN